MDRLAGAVPSRLALPGHSTCLGPPRARIRGAVISDAAAQRQFPGDTSPQIWVLYGIHVSLRQRSLLQSLAVMAVLQVSVEKPAVFADERVTGCRSSPTHRRRCPDGGRFACPSP